MKHSNFLLAAAVVLFVYTCLNYYCIKRSGQALSGLGIFKTIIICALIVWASALPLGRIAELYVRNPLTRLSVIAGSLYLGVFFYLLLATALVDCARLGNRFFHFLSPSFLDNPYPALRNVWLIFAAALCVMTIIGNRLATHPCLRTLDLKVAKKSSGLKELTIAAVSDIHFGTVLGERHMRRIVRLVKQAEPDLVLLVGDVFDEDIDDSQRSHIVGLLKELSCPMGVYAVTGNHEYYSGLAKALSVLEEGGVIVLQDSVVRRPGAFTLVGRKDLTAMRMGDGRTSLKELMEGVDRNLPCILMDHQPFHLEESAENGVDIQLSGHTHHGQLFPLNLLYRWIYETSWGCIQKGKTWIVVSCGAGTWGPPIRTNSRSEVLKIKVTF